MEYRKRRRGTRTSTGYGGASPAYAAVAIVFFGVVYLISASKLGTWVANNWIAPVLSRSGAVLSEPVDKTPVPTPQTVVVAELEQTFTLPEKSFHAVQMGVYAERANADAQSNALRAIGAAGYILEDGGRFRVLASAYPDADSAQKVSAQLLEAGVECRLHPIACVQRRLTLTGTQQQLSVLGGAIDGMDALLAAIYDVCIAFDREKQDVASGIATLSPLQSRASSVCEELAALSTESDAGLDRIVAFYQTVRDEGTTLLALQEGDTAAFSSGLKRLYLTTLITLI